MKEQYLYLNTVKEAIEEALDIVEKRLTAAKESGNKRAIQDNLVNKIELSSFMMEIIEVQIDFLKNNNQEKLNSLSEKLRRDHIITTIAVVYNI